MILIGGACEANDSGKPDSEQPAPAVASKVDFMRDVQPILAKRCYACHGPDEAEGSLRLSDEEGAFAETDSGETAIERGDDEASNLFTRNTNYDEYERIPPEAEPVDANEK